MPADTGEFSAENLPWLDKYYVEIDTYVRNLPPDELPPYDLRQMLVHWVQRGYVRFPQLIEHELIDAYLSDAHALIDDPSSSGVRFNVENFGVHEAKDYPPEAWDQHHFRIMDLHNVSTAGKALCLHPRIVEWLRHVFRETPVAMQTLTFMYSTEQTAHQDFAYVVAEVPSHLAAIWVALEDVDPDAGPLFYYPGSHALVKFDWGNGLFFNGESSKDPDEFAEYLEGEASRAQMQRLTFCPKKGDVFFWHSSLVHGGSPVIDHSLTRRSLVVHYSTVAGYPRDRRLPEEVPLVFAMNGGLLYGDPHNPGEEDRFASWPLPEDLEVARRDLRLALVGPSPHTEVEPEVEPEAASTEPASSPDALGTDLDEPVPQPQVELAPEPEVVGTELDDAASSGVAQTEPPRRARRFMRLR